MACKDRASVKISSLNQETDASNPNPELELFDCPYATFPAKVSLRHCQSRLNLAERIVKHSYFYQKYLLGNQPEDNLSEGDLLKCLQCEKNPQRHLYVGRGWEVFHGYKLPAKEGLYLEPVLTNAQLLSEYGFSAQEAEDLRQKAGLPFFEVQGEFYYRREQVNHWLYRRFGKNSPFKPQAGEDAGPEVPELFTVADLARMFRVTMETVRHWHRIGRLPPAQKLGRRLLWPKEEVEAFAGERKAVKKNGD